MAILNGMYIFVADESLTYGADVTEHTVEEGIDIADHVKRRATSMSITGEIVGRNASSITNKLKQLCHSGKLCSYSGRSTFTNCLITDFVPSYTYNIWGGCEFSMTLKEIRTASTSYKKSKNDTSKAGTQQVKKKSTVTYVYHTVKKGDTIWDLVAAPKAPYKKYGLTCAEVMALNPKAFSRAGDFRTLQIGKKIIVGKR